MPFYYSYCYGFRDKVLSAKDKMKVQKKNISDCKQKDSFKWGSR